MSSVSGGGSGGGVVARDEIRELRLQVDKLKERLDFMAPMLSLLNFTQDFFQRVECEASVQLMRLKNAKMTTPPSAAQSGGAADDKMVDTAKWLHTMTDLIMGLQGSGSLPSDIASPLTSSRAGAPTSEVCTPPQMAAAALRGSHSPPPQISPALRGGQVPATTRSSRSPPPQMGWASRGGPSRPGSAAGGSAVVGSASGLSTSGGSVGGGNGGSGVRLVTPRTTSPQPPALQPTPPLREFGTGPRSTASVASSGFAPSSASAAGAGTLAHSGGSTGGTGSATVGLARLQHRSPQELGDAASDFGGRRARGIDSTLEFGGLALGKGTWANAYRQARGDRRDALRLLCSTGIVTERELADDLTVISEEHIEECVSIAGEILQKWPPERGPPPLSEAKAFFEERLAALYMKRAPSPF